MSLIRPVVLVFQEFANPTVTPVSPDLNALIVGPAYWIQDYFAPGTTTPADKADIKLAADYGIFENTPADVATPVGNGVIVAADPPNNVVGALLDATSVKVFLDAVRVKITNGTAATTANGSNAIVVGDAVDFTTGVAKVLPGDRIVFTDGGAKSEWRTVLAVVDATHLTVTADIDTTGGFAPGGAQKWRIERQLSDQVVDPSFYTTSGNQISINGAITLVANGVAKTVEYAKVYVQYRSLRQDLQQVDSVGNENDILVKIGRLDARNPLAVGCFVAQQNTTTTILFYGVKSNDLAGQTLVRDAITPRDDIYAIVPLTADVSVIAMWNTNNVGLALPDESKGRPQRFRVVLGSGTLPLTSTVGQKSSTATTLTLASSSSGVVSQLTIPGIDLIAGGVIPGDLVHITIDAAGVTRVGTYHVVQVISATVLEVAEALPGGAQSGNATLAIKDATDAITRVASAAYIAVASAALDDLFLILKDPNGTFITSGIIPGDVIEIPQNPNSGTIGAVFSSFLVASIISENRLQIINNGNNTAAVENELPHGVKRIGGALVTQGTITYQIIRNLTKDQQVTQLVALAQSFSSRRTVLVWPDKVDVAGVQGGLAQPGCYLACAVGGMTAGLPSHQGFTFLGIAGIAQIYNSNTYFSDDQLTQIMQGGWYVFSQQTPVSLPFTIHQLTTDPSTLENGEYSVVKNFDFVSLFFVDILSLFLGKYNITPETMAFLRTALNDGIDTLRLRTFARIGAPLSFGTIADLAVSQTNADRVVAKLNIGLPKPLNVIELHLVA